MSGDVVPGATVLTDRQRTEFIAQLMPHQERCFAVLYKEADEFGDDELRRLLDNKLRFTTSRNGWRAKQIERIAIQKAAARATAKVDTIGSEHPDNAPSGGLDR